MAINKNALIRYKTIDTCLQNQYRTWTLEDLIEACSDALYEYEGKDSTVSKRTVQLDIQMMRSEKLGYNAPIEVYRRKYYRYAEADYSITNIPLTEKDMQILSESVEMLKQFSAFSLFSDLGGIINRLEDKIYTEKTDLPAIIHLDKNEQLKGLEHLDILYQAILKKVVLHISYQSFKAREASILTIHPFILKEFNNRWFLVGQLENINQTRLATIALDRIVSITYDTTIRYTNTQFDGNQYYKEVIGVTVSNTRPSNIYFRIDNDNAPYVRTKPFHSSQQIVEETVEGVVFSIRVQVNFELERLILGFGESIEILQPRSLRKRIQQKLHKAHQQYINK